MIGPPIAKRTKFIIISALILTVGLFMFVSNSSTKISKADIAQLSSACTYISIARYTINFVPSDGNLYEHLLDGVRELEAFGQSYPQYEFLHISANEALSAIAPHMPDFEPNDPRYASAVTDLFKSKTDELDKASTQCRSVLQKVSGMPTTTANYSTYDPFWNSNG